MALPSISTLTSLDRSYRAKLARAKTKEEKLKHKEEALDYSETLQEKFDSLTSKSGREKVGNLSARWQEILFEVYGVPSERVYLLNKGAASVFDINLPVSRVRFIVNGPGMLFAHLRFVSTLELKDGLTFGVLQNFAKNLKTKVICGNQGNTNGEVKVVDTRVGCHIEIGFGPMGMYQSELLIESIRKESLEDLVARILPEEKTGGEFIGLCAVPGTGHHHGTLLEEPDANHGHGHH